MLSDEFEYIKIMNDSQLKGISEGDFLRDVGMITGCNRIFVTINHGAWPLSEVAKIKRLRGVDISKWLVIGFYGEEFYRDAFLKKNYLPGLRNYEKYVCYDACSGFIMALDVYDESIVYICNSFINYNKICFVVDKYDKIADGVERSSDVPDFITELREELALVDPYCVGDCFDIDGETDKIGNQIIRDYQYFGF